MAKTGWIKLHRQITESALYKEPRKFSRSEAWIDLLLRANHEENPGTIVIVKSELAKAWNWDRRKLDRFIDYLVNGKMCAINGTYNGTRNGTSLTIENWAFYQGNSTRNGTRNGTDNGTKNENLPYIFKEEKNIYMQIFDFWNEQEIIVHKNITEKMAKAIDKALTKASPEEILTSIERYAECLEDDSYFFSYRWTLDIFLSRANGFTDFLDDGSKWISYQNHLDQKNSQPTPRKRNLVTDEDLGF